MEILRETTERTMKAVIYPFGRGGLEIRVERTCAWSNDGWGAANISWSMRGGGFTVEEAREWNVALEEACRIADEMNAVQVPVTSEAVG